MIDLDLVADELQLITGTDIPIEGLGITIRQPTIKEISMLGESNYFIALQVFTMNKEQLHISSPEVNNWAIFQQSMTQKIDGVKDTKVLLSNFLQLFFINNVNIGPRSIMVMSKDGIKNIEPDDFDYLQQIIGRIGGKTLFATEDGVKYNPKNRRAAEIAEKMKKAHKRLAKVKAGGVDTNKKGFLSRYVKTVAIGTSNSLAEVNAMTLLQLSDMMQMYMAWEAYDLDVKSRLAGAKNEKELVHWTVANDKKDDGIGRI